MTNAIANAAMLSFKFQQDQDLELWQFGVKLYKRDAADWDELLAVADNWVASDIGGLINKSHHVGTAYSEWGTSGWTGFHQQRATTQNVGLGTNAVLPPQCAAVITLYDSIDTNISVRRRRGRIYFGGIAAGNIDSNGKLTSAYAQGLGTAIQALQTALVATPGPPFPNSGIAIVSEAEGQIMLADQYGVGLAVDTQRRRRRKMQEAISYVSFS